MSPSRWQRSAAFLVVVAVAATGCRSGPEERLQLGTVSLTQAEFLYGRSVEPHPDVTFADDVVVIPGGEHAVRAATADGLTWTIDPGYRGVDQIEVGKVMFLTSQALGRVHVLDRVGDDLVVTILPVGLTEVIWEGEFFWEEVPIELSSVMFRPTGELPWSIVDPGAAPDDDAEVVGASYGTITLAQAPPDGPSVPQPEVDTSPLSTEPAGDMASGRPASPPPTHGHLPLVTVGHYTFYPACCETGVGLRLLYERAGMKVGAKLGMESSALSYSGGFTMSGGEIEYGSARVVGGQAMVYAFVATTEIGITGNIRDEVTLPGHLEIPLPRVLGVPFDLKIGHKVLLSTGFTAKDSYLRADGSFTFTDNVGFERADGTDVQHPPQNRQLRSSLLDSVRGQSIGVTGIVVAHRLQFQAALGPSIASAGPYIALVTSLGVTRGSDAGSPLVVCRGVDLNLSLETGLRYEVSNTVGSLVNDVLALLGVGPTLESEMNVDALRRTIIERSARAPAAKTCQY